MEYYFTENKNVDIINSRLLINGFEYKHLIRVLRKKVNDNLTITDGIRNIYKCKIVEITKTDIVCEIVSKDYNLYESELMVNLFVSPLRNSDRFEFLIEKVVELGVFEIFPVISKYTVVKDRFSETKMNRLRKIIVGAMGQSQRCYLPLLHNTVTFENFLGITNEKLNKIVYYEHSENTIKKQITNSVNEINILIGPEGGFDKDEIEKLLKNNWQVESLGERKLRTETAAIISVFEQLIKHKGKDIL
jgi:16S rRNA (uracil1498-N3)-methyltransferase